MGAIIGLLNPRRNHRRTGVAHPVRDRGTPPVPNRKICTNARGLSKPISLAPTGRDLSNNRGVDLVVSDA